MIGPQRLFSHGQLYYGHAFFFLVGAIAPLIQWSLHKKLRLDVLKYLNFPIIFGGTGYLPPATPLNYVPWVLVCYLFNNFIRRRHFSWWFKYNCENIFLAFRENADFSFFLIRVWVRCPVRRFGRGLWHWCHDHLLCTAIPQERRDRQGFHFGVVGQYCLHQNGRL